MSLRRAMLKVYWGMRGVIAPELRYSQDLYEEVLKRYVRPDMEWIDLGCGHQVLPAWRAKEEKGLVASCKYIVGLDYNFDALKNHPNISRKVRGDMTRLPFRANSFDLVTANMVVEHLDNPDVQFLEVSRVLRPGGIFIFHTPSAYGYPIMLARFVPRGPKLTLVRLLDGRKAEDVYPAFYRANTRRRIEELSRLTGLEVSELRMLVTDATFNVLPPIAAVELAWIRLLMTETFKPLRTNVIAVLTKPSENGFLRRPAEPVEAVSTS
jgi:ubiquinone/menaquinone biosynthesis C-methylase UbiE